MFKLGQKDDKSAAQAEVGREMFDRIQWVVELINAPSRHPEYSYFDEEDWTACCEMLESGLRNGCLTNSEYEELKNKATSAYQNRDERERSEARHLASAYCSDNTDQGQITHKGREINAASLPLRLGRVPQNRGDLVKEIRTFMRDKKAALRELDRSFMGSEIDADEYYEVKETLEPDLHEYPITRNVAITLMESEWTDVGRSNLLKRLEDLQRQSGNIVFELCTSVSSLDPDKWSIEVVPATEIKRRIRIRKNHGSPWSPITFNQDEMWLTDNGAVGSAWDLS